MNTDIISNPQATKEIGQKTVLDARSQYLRKIMVRMLVAAKRGHLASAFSIVEILRVLYDDVLKFDAQEPRALLRDRCILSKGHGCMALYAILYDKKFFPESELELVCKSKGILGGHPEYPRIPGVEASTGSLGHGLAIGIGFALRARMDKLNYRTWVVLGDGECNEGSIWEGALCAGKHKLENLNVVVDYNKYQSYSTTYEVQDLEPFIDKWKSFGFAVTDVDGHDVEKLKKVFSKTPLEKNKPTAIICHTVKGKGVSFVENNLNWHHKTNLTEAELKAFSDELGSLV